MFCIFLNFVYTLRYFCTFKKQNRGWFQSRHIFVLLKTKSRLDFNLATCKLSIQFPPRKSPWSFLRRQINGEKFGRQLFWMFAIKIAGRTPIWLIFSRGFPYFAIAEGFHYHLLGLWYVYAFHLSRVHTKLSKFNQFNLPLFEPFHDAAS